MITPVKMAEAQLVQVVKSIKNLTECCICEEPYKSPKALPCIHTFCLKCIEDWRRSCESSSDPLSCPVCRKVFAIPVGGLKKLPTNFTVEKLMEIDVLTAKTCEICRPCPAARPAVRYCLDCRQHACEACADGHPNITACKDHRLIPVRAEESYGQLRSMTSASNPSAVSVVRLHPLSAAAYSIPVQARQVGLPVVRTAVAADIRTNGQAAPSESTSGSGRASGQTATATTNSIEYAAAARAPQTSGVPGNDGKPLVASTRFGRPASASRGRQSDERSASGQVPTGPARPTSHHDRSNRFVYYISISSSALCDYGGIYMIYLKL